MSTDVRQRAAPGEGRHQRRAPRVVDSKIVMNEY
jgi:hypothetical protein